MKIKYKVISFLLVIVTLFSVLSINNVIAKESNPFVSHYEDVYNNGYSVPKTKDFIKMLNVLGQLYEKITGVDIISQKTRITIEGFLKDIYDEISQDTEETMDFQLFFDSLPISNSVAKSFYQITGINKEIFVDYLYDKTKECDEKGDSMASVYYFARIYFSIFEEIILGMAPVNNSEEIYQVVVKVVYEDGSTEDLTPGIYYNTQTKILYNENGKGVLNLGFNLESNSSNYILTTVINSWQRGFGFSQLYDLLSYSTPFFDYATKRIKFIYDQKEWMIQLWKGRYIITNGCEIGVYYRELNSKGTYYDCVSDEDMLMLAVDLYHQDELIFSRQPTMHWWLTGFAFAPKCYLPESIRMEGSVGFDDSLMAEAFYESIKKIEDIKSEKIDNTILFIW